MKRFKDLYIKLADSELVEFINELSEQIVFPWRRVPEKEEQFSFLNKDKMYCFERSETEHLPSAGLVILKKEDNCWYVPNIVPIVSGSLSYEEYNGILDEFYSSYLSKVAKKRRVDIEVTSGEIEDIDVFGEHGAKLLRTFSTCANQSTGSSHPLDQKRWFSFIIEVCRTKKDIDSGYLERVLLEQGWSERMANELVIEFEFAQSLIEFMEQE
ncbi:hypothetical protein [Entomomonas asaccharolytica]|uniref:Uncharacterized protein n=1 Tax=Entomomonas asaccharolytica TaxID=2785331 RepID=A0A974NGG7_9GAMM|nr:hypothetical protein [Entomomonas asaccharolytica]QQP86067.1 hypothetical protein JHT90_02085 [Entomomonas asaccharolytica]